MAPILRFCLPDIGMCRNFSRKPVCTPYPDGIRFYAFILPTGYSSDFKVIISHTFQGILTGHLYRTSLELLLLEAGQGTSILNLQSTSVNLLGKACVVKSFVLFLIRYEIALCHDISLQKPRENDVLVMTASVELGLPLEDLWICNHFRIYLRALYLSDISTGDGVFIKDSEWDGYRDTEFWSKSWPHYGRPNRSSWEIWRRVIKLALITRGRKLRNPLGDWLFFRTSGHGTQTTMGGFMNFGTVSGLPIQN